MKVTKAKAHLLPASLRFAPGNLRCSGMGWVAKLTARLWRFVLTAAASQSTKGLHSAVQLLAHTLCASALAKEVEPNDLHELCAVLVILSVLSL